MHLVWDTFEVNQPSLILIREFTLDIKDKEGTVLPNLTWEWSPPGVCIAICSISIFAKDHFWSEGHNCHCFNLDIDFSREIKLKTQTKRGYRVLIDITSDWFPPDRLHIHLLHLKISEWPLLITTANISTLCKRQHFVRMGCPCMSKRVQACYKYELVEHMPGSLTQLLCVYVHNVHYTYSICSLENSLVWSFFQ